MTFTKFLGAIVGLLVAAVLLVWVFVSLAALVYALTQGDGAAARTYAVFLVLGIAVCAVAAGAARRVARSRSTRQ